MRDEIDQLPPRLRDVLSLSVDQDRSYQEIAQILNISNENVRKRISQARKILRERLREYEGGIDSKSLSDRTSCQSPRRTHNSPVKPERLTGLGEIEQIESVVEEVSPELKQDENLLAVEAAVISGEELTIDPTSFIDTRFSQVALNRSRILLKLIAPIGEKLQLRIPGKPRFKKLVALSRMGKIIGEWRDRIEGFRSSFPQSKLLNLSLDSS